MKLVSPKGANVVVGNRRYVFAPSVFLDVPDEVAQYLYGTGRFYREGDSLIDPFQDPHLNTARLRIGVYRIGGYGDGLLGTCVIKALSRKYPDSLITAYSTSSVRMLWEGMPEIHILENKHITNLNSNPVTNQRHDLFFNLMPDCGAYFKPLPQLEKDIKAYAKANSIMEQYQRRQGCRNHKTPFCHENNMEALDLYNFMFGTDATVKDMYIAKRGDLSTVLSRMSLPARYITIHDWAFNGRQTKSWFPEYWKTLNELLRKEYKCPIVQIGGAGEESLHSDIDLRGKTTFWESTEIIDKGIFHVDNESTPAHVCAGTSHPCAVLCGATSVYWRHRENLNIVGTYPCQECEGAPDWYKVCEDNGSFGCMKSITPEYAFERIKPYMNERI